MSMRDREGARGTVAHREAGDAGRIEITQQKFLDWFRDGDNAQDKFNEKYKTERAVGSANLTLFGFLRQHEGLFRRPGKERKRKTEGAGVFSGLKFIDMGAGARRLNQISGPQLGALLAHEGAEVFLVDREAQREGTKAFFETHFSDKAHFVEEDFESWYSAGKKDKGDVYAMLATSDADAVVTSRFIGSSPNFSGELDITAPERFAEFAAGLKELAPWQVHVINTGDLGHSDLSSPMIREALEKSGLKISANSYDTVKEGSDRYRYGIIVLRRVEK